MSQVPNLFPQKSHKYSGWPSSASKQGYTQFLKRVVLVYVFLLCPLSACASSSLGDRNGGLFYLVTFVTIIVAVYPLISQSINKQGSSVSLPPIGGGNGTSGSGNGEQPRYHTVIRGRAKVVNAFMIRGDLVGAGCEVTSGKLTRSARIRVWRRNKIVFEGNIDSLKQHYNGVSEVASGDGCSVVVRGFSRFQVGDTIEAFVNVPVGEKPKGGSGSKGEQKKPGEGDLPLKTMFPAQLQAAGLLHSARSECAARLS